MKKRIVLIPPWIQETLKRNSQPLAACLEFNTLRPLLSLHDLIGFATLQNYTEHVLGVELGDDLYSVLYDSIPSDQQDVQSFFVNSVYALAGDLSFRKEIWGRLFEADSRTDQHKEPFITYDLTPAVCGVVICPGFFVSGDTDELQRSLIEALLKVLYVYDTYSEVAKTSLFKRYLELLSLAPATAE